MKKVLRNRCSKGLWLLLFIVELEALSGCCFFSCFASGFFFFFLLGFRLFEVDFAGVDEQVVPKQHFLDVAGVNVLGVVVGEHFLEIGEQVGAGGFLYSFNELILSDLNTGQRFLSASDSTMAPFLVCDTSS